MLTRKHIAMEDDFLKKLEPLIVKNEGNLSAAMRDAIELADIALKTYGSKDKAVSAIIKGDSGGTRDQCLALGQCIVTPSQTFHWLLEQSRGLLIDPDTLIDIIDPFKITSLPQLQDSLNDKLSGFSWQTAIRIEHDDALNPNKASVLIKGNYRNRLEFIAGIIGLYLANYKDMGIISVRRRMGCMKMDLQKKKNPEEAYADLLIHFGNFQDIHKELNDRQDFWRNLIREHSATNYNLVTLHRNFYEDLLVGKIPKAIMTIEAVSRRPVEEMPLQELLRNLKQVSETSRIINRIDIEEEIIKIHHGYRNMRAADRVKEIFLGIMEASGYIYSAQLTSNLIILHHQPEVEKRILELLEKLKKGEQIFPHGLLEYIAFLKERHLDIHENIRVLGRRIGKQVMRDHEKAYGIMNWTLASFQQVFSAMDAKLRRQSEWELHDHTSLYTVRKCPISGNADLCHIHRNVFRGALEYTFEGRAELEIIKLLSHNDDFCEVRIHAIP
jgi:predicted hydrocarbon binding protein